ncbi:pyruvate, phosphate dikinase [Paenibacillus sp. S-38]|uniref:pyruvate, phosphate dikinase n=1 Tax=Paenibacillus sp. S-38 TaxID=3416710 RepID=UPI003CF966D0
MRKQRVLFFTEGNAEMKTLLGGKGANLAEMTKAGLPVPPGFTVTTEVCRAYFAGGNLLPEGLMDEVASAMSAIEALKNQGFGRAEAPLLVSVRSGSVTSMPGMMDTILNLGLNDETVAGLAVMTGNPRFAYDCYRRLLQMFGNVVFEIEHYHFERELLLLKKEQGCTEDSELSAERLEELCRAYQRVIKKKAGVAFPQAVFDQLHMAIEAVFRSWNNPRAVVYRKLNRIPDHQGTAVNIQSMVFGNLGEDSGTGVLFTRNPSTGEKVLYGEYLMNAQGEDVVAGIRTPQEIAGLAGEQPALHLQIEEVAQKLERHYRDMQDIEFTIENGKLYILQTRSGKRTAQAAVKIAADLVEEGVISKPEALERIEVSHLDQLLHRSIDEGQPLNVLASGLPASPGAATGQAVFDADTAEEWARAGRQVLLVRAETTPEDIHGVLAATGVLTTRGGMTSHAAVVARGMGKPCVCGCEALRIGEGSFTIGGKQVNEGEWISIDGATGRVILGKLLLKEPEISPELSTLLGWADEIRRLKVLTNADTPEDAAKARELGAEGIGLCRTEHMFMSVERVPVVQEMILAEDDAARREALGKLLPMQQEDFEGIFRSMAGLPVTVRLLDPPLHEFLPSLEHLIVQQARLSCDASSDRAEKEKVDTLLRKVRGLHEMNPMLGTRGCRLGILFEDIYEMQVEALFRAALTCRAEGIEVLPELMIPLVGHANELKRLRELVDRTAARVLGELLPEVPYRVGTMIEVPRAAITAGQIAWHADFFSFGTNDLTQMTFGYSRDDAEGKFLTHYLEHKLLPENPFQVLDEEGVGELILWAVEKGRAVKPALKTGVCGEHGGDKDSIFFCHGAGLDYVSCSPYRVPLARIAAAQAMIAAGRKAALEREAVQTA